MSKEKEKATVKSEERRHFLHLAGTAGFTTAVLAAAGGTLMSSEASAQTAQEEKERERPPSTLSRWPPNMPSARRAAIR